MENWMISETNWTLFSANYEYSIEESENLLSVESWMTSEMLWDKNYDFTEHETELKVEGWMVNETIWSKN
jgi:hypothetical protein